MMGLLFVLIANIVMLVEDAKAFHHPITSVHSTTPSHNGTTSANATLDLEDCEYLNGFSSIPNQPTGAFRLFTYRACLMVQLLVLIWSETGTPASFFNKWIPVLDNEHSLLALGVFEGAIAISFLSQFLEPFPLAAGFILLIGGILNISVCMLERPREIRRIAYWKAKKQQQSLHSRMESGSNAGSDVGGSASIFTEKSHERRPQYGFGRQGTSDEERTIAPAPPSYYSSPPVRTRAYSPPNVGTSKGRYL